MIAHPDETVEESDRRLTYEATFESLQNPRRRRTLQYLTERNEPVPVGELADQITAWEQSIDVADVPPGARKSVYNSLIQTHLPHLAARGVVEYDRAAGTVELAPNASQLVRYVALVTSDDDRWSVVFLAAVGVAGAAVVASWLGALAFPAMVLNAVVVGLFLAVSVAYAVSVRR